MKEIIIYILLFNSIFAQAQNDKKKLVKEITEKYDLSVLWASDSILYVPNSEYIPREEPFGYIGKNFQRFRIHFMSVIKDQKSSNEYFVYAKTKVRNNICVAQGKIIVEDYKIYRDEDSPEALQGIINGTYFLFEDSKQAGTGILLGSFETRVCIDSTENLHYNWLALGAGGYLNNQFEGTWTSYKTKEVKACNWGDYRIPKARTLGLDIGAAEFSPADPYLKNGWNFYQIVYNTTDPTIIEKALKKEFSPWWD